VLPNQTQRDRFVSDLNTIVEALTKLQAEEAAKG